MATLVLRTLAWLVIGPPLLLFAIATSPIWLLILVLHTFVAIGDYAITGKWKFGGA